ncbi:hypothetical protein [Burkholderia cepacia]|uniref:hypothetical protein n=1 Tax=Burkholderia cepacia TaxID=292 RepID=UPI001588ED97|nr:hypothetical protein [Burkholderia cepacia]
MGQFVGNGNWAFSYEEKRAYKNKKREKYLADLEVKKEITKANYISLTQLKSFLSNNDVMQYFPKPDKEISIMFGTMKLFEFKKVVKTIKSNKLQIKIKKAFEDIENDEFKQTIRYLSLDLVLKNKEDTAPMRVKI